jgi:hypothetical protein
VTDDELARLLGELVAAQKLRPTLPTGSPDRLMVERAIVVLDLRIRRSLGSAERDGNATRARDGAMATGGRGK